MPLGATDGAVVGAPLGDALGAALGPTDGPNDGADVEGMPVGDCDGVVLGTAVLGSVVGVAVGPCVGAMDGTAVLGAAVGEMVHCEHAAEVQPKPSLQEQYTTCVAGVSFVQIPLSSSQFALFSAAVHTSECVGPLDGIPVGAVVGVDVDGAALGTDVVGAAVGAEDGTPVGEVDGDAVRIDRFPTN